MKSRPLIIGFAGLKRAGKDTAISAIKAALPHVETMQWALPLKALAMELFHLSWQEVEGIDYDREQIHPGLNGHSVRQLLEFIGTDFARRFDPSIWVRQLQENIQHLPASTELILISGTRYPNEAAVCGRVWWVDRGPGEVVARAPHASETSLTALDCDRILYNAGSKEAFGATCVAAARGALASHQRTLI